MNLSTTTMLAILDGHGSPQERQEMRRLMQAAGVDAPLQRWRAVGARLELTLLNGRVIYLTGGSESLAAAAEPEAVAGEIGEDAAESAGASHPPAANRRPAAQKSSRKARQAGSHGLHP